MSVSMRGEGDLLVFQLFDEVGKKLAGHADGALFDHLRAQIFADGDLAVRREQGDGVVLRGDLDALEHGVDGLCGARLDRFDKPVGQIDPFTDKFHAFLP